MEAQCHDLQKIAHDMIIKGMHLYEQIQIVVIIDKQPCDWKDFLKSASS